MTPGFPTAPAVGLLAALAAGLLAGSGGAFAQAEVAGGRIELELNAAETVGKNCRVTLVASNGSGFDIGKLVVEVALIGGDGAVADFLRVGVLPVQPQRSRAQRFEVADTPCEQLSRLLLNDVPTCENPAGEALDCGSLIVPSSRASIGFVTQLFGD